MIGAIAAFGLCTAAALILARFFAGPTLYDRALTALSLNAKIALVVAAIAAIAGDAALVDQAILQVAVGFALALAMLKILRYRSLQPALKRGPAPGGEA